MINMDMQKVCIKRMKDIIGIYDADFNLSQVSDENVEKILHQIEDLSVKANVLISGSIKHVLYNLENFRPEIRSEFEQQVFNLWYKSFKALDFDPPGQIEPEMESSGTKEVSAVVKMVQEPGDEEKSEFKADKISEEPAIKDATEPEIKEMIEKLDTAEKTGSEHKEIVEDLEVADESEFSVEEIVEESEAFEESESEDDEPMEEPVSSGESETIEKVPGIESEDLDEEQTSETKHERSESYVKADTQAEIPLKKPKRDWFDLVLDISAAFMKFILRMLPFKKSGK